MHPSAVPLFPPEALLKRLPSSSLPLVLLELEPPSQLPLVASLLPRHPDQQQLLLPQPPLAPFPTVLSHWWECREWQWVDWLLSREPCSLCDDDGFKKGPLVGAA